MNKRSKEDFMTALAFEYGDDYAKQAFYIVENHGLIAKAITEIVEWLDDVDGGVDGFDVDGDDDDDL